jgi:O-antigen biosynthesis protein
VSLAIYNVFLSTLGGGERSTLAFARCLQDISNERVVVYALTSERVKPAYLEKAFGISLRGVGIEMRDTPSELDAMVRAARPSFFLNHTYNSRIPNVGEVGIYAMMFPSREAEYKHLKTYDRIFCNSQFCAKYTALYYPDMESRVGVMHPPISNRTMNVDLDLKDWAFAVNIGRYAFSGHSKKQFELASAVRALNAQREVPLRLACMGRVTESEYFDHCLPLADTFISFKANVSETEIARNLERAGVYIHGCGLDLDPGTHPERCEHFGLAILEAMRAGCIPVVLGRGGVLEYIQHGLNGFLFDTVEELGWLLRVIQDLPRRTKHHIASAAMATAERFCYDAFVERLEHTLDYRRSSRPFAAEVNYV